MRIGIISVQGSMREHTEAFQRAEGADVSIVEVKKPCHLVGVDGIVLPGGESTTIGRLLRSNGLFDVLQRMGAEGVPIMGTCAGCVLLSSRLANPSLEEKTPLLKLMSMAAGRNAFGRQRESFEDTVEIDGIGSFPGVFIRAPAITEAWGNCRVLGRVGNSIVAVEQDNLLAMSFHPELSENSGVHLYFLDKIQHTR